MKPMKINIYGTAPSTMTARISKEYIRSWVQASLTVLGFHNKHILNPTAYKDWIQDYNANKAKDRSCGVFNLNDPRAQEKAFSVVLLNEAQWLEWHKDGVIGISYSKHSVIHIRKDWIVKAKHPAQKMATVILHEVIHQCCTFDANSNERCTSTLTAKLKPTVNAIARALCDNAYKNAAYLAHTQISYTTEAQGGTEDEYNHEQFNHLEGIKDKFGVPRGVQAYL